MNFNDEDFNEDDFEDSEADDFEKSPLYLKAREIMKTVDVLCESMSAKDAEMHSSVLLESAMIIPAKIAGAFGGGSWLICMQNAAIIRYHAQYLHTATSGLKVMTKADKDYIKVMRDEMEEFRELFKQWVESFKQMEDEDYQDEWGLFVRPL